MAGVDPAVAEADALRSHDPACHDAEHVDALPRRQVALGPRAALFLIAVARGVIALPQPGPQPEAEPAW
jgi:hypothetical protein